MQEPRFFRAASVLATKARRASLPVTRFGAAPLVATPDAAQKYWRPRNLQTRRTDDHGHANRRCVRSAFAAGLRQPARLQTWVLGDRQHDFKGSIAKASNGERRNRPFESGVSVA